MATLVHTRTTTASRPPLILIALACIASLVAGSAATLVFESEPSSGATAVHDEVGATLIHRFYAAVNETLRTEDSLELAALLAPDFVAHPAGPGMTAGRDELIARLLSLYRTAPGTTITVEAIHVAGDHVTARVAVTGEVNATFLGIPLDNGDVWSAMDLFRIAGGDVVEQWGGPRSGTLAQAETAFQIDLVADQEYGVRLSHRTYAPNARPPREQADGPVALVGEHGTLTVRDDADINTMLAPGEALVVDAGAWFTTSNDEHTPAEVLVLEVVPWRIASARAAPPTESTDVVTESLSWGPAGTLPPTAVVRVGSVTLAPGAELPLHVAAGIEIFHVESGTLGVIADEPVWVVHDLATASSTGEAATLGERQSAIVPAGAAATYRNAGTESARLLIVTIQPAESLDPRP